MRLLSAAEASKGPNLWILCIWPRQSLQVIMQHMDVGNGVGGSRILDDQIIDGLVLALVETNSEVCLGQGAEVVADIRVLARHIDEYCAERQLFDEFVLVRFQHTHETEVFGRNLGIEVALQDSVRHLVAKYDKSASAGTKQTFRTALNVLDDAFVAFVQDNQNRAKSLKIRHFYHRFFSEELLQGFF